MMALLIPVLGDQLTHSLASLRDVDRGTAVVLMAEVRAECTYVKHHKKKIALVLSAMRHFAAELREAGWTVDYVMFDDPANTHSLRGEVAAARHRATAIRAVEAGEYRLLQNQRGWGEATGLPVELLDDDRFVCSRPKFESWTEGRTTFRMEYFYRDMRKATDVLMTPDGKPEGGSWNYDHDNRATPPRGLNYPAPERFAPDPITQDVLELVAREFSGHFGDLDNFNLPVTRANALRALDHFITLSLPDFGRYQDAMIVGQDYLYHSVLSLCLNTGLLGPLEVCRAAEAAYRDGSAPINSVEGFIRQIIGWREYMRGMYWRDMPKLAGRNALQADRPLPDFYWTGDTDMRCLSESVGQTRREAYAHHIQRLMVLGNFAAIAGVSPQALSDWFLVVYFDAYEWVEMPNVIGMSQYADGGAIASKPYVSTGAYINRMSDYCRRCRYDVKQRTGPDACPFNALYWDFLARHEERFRGNGRMRNIYLGWDRLGPAEQKAIRDQAATTLDALKPEAPGWAR
jgi:deoxyribodipyrimidine photolyase-related protein